MAGRALVSRGGTVTGRALVSRGGTQDSSNKQQVDDNLIW